MLRSDERYPYLDDQAWAALAAHRADLRPVVGAARGGVEVDDGELRWWTFAGGRINSTLRYALEAVEPGWKVITDNFLIKIRGDGVADFRAALDRLAEPEFWEDDRLWTQVAASLPNYRLNKFQPLMPPWVEREVIASYLLNVGDACRWLSGLEGDQPRVPDGVRPSPPPTLSGSPSWKTCWRSCPSWAGRTTGRSSGCGPCRSLRRPSPRY